MRECESALGLLASRRPAAPRRRSADGFALPRSALPVKQGAQGAGSSAAAEEARSERPLVKFTSRLLLMRFGSGRLSQGRIKTLRGRQFIRGGLVTGDSSPDIGVLWPQGVVVVEAQFPMLILVYYLRSVEYEQSSRENQPLCTQLQMSQMQCISL